jgi:sugar transferase (PEP-CTERM/EpsH1 system associated)
MKTLNTKPKAPRNTARDRGHGTRFNKERWLEPNILQELADKQNHQACVNERISVPSHELGKEWFDPASSQLIRGSAPSVAQSQARSAELRILHVINRLDVGGTELSLLKVMSGLGNGLFRHRVCTTRGYDADLANQKQLTDRVLVAGRQRPGFQFPIFRLARIMGAYRPHIVHSRNWGAIEAIPAARLAGVPVVIHSEHGYELDMLGGLPYRRRLLRHAFYTLCDSLFAVTEDLRRFHGQQAWVPAKRFRVIYNGVDTERFAPRLEKRWDVRKELGLADDVFVVGTVGRMVPIKDHLTLLRAARQLVSRNVDVHVLLVGSGSEQSRLEKFVHDSVEMSGRVSFLGSRGSVGELLQAMDVFVLPSICEGFSNTLLEAMASGLPTVATRVGGNPEVVDEGHSGWLFSPGDYEELAGQLEELAARRDLRARLGEAARTRAVSRFALGRMLDDYRDLYCELACRRGVLHGVS